jgi:hypothetical protein
MSKDSNLFSGQPSFKQIISLLDKPKIKRKHKARRMEYISPDDGKK